MKNLPALVPTQFLKIPNHHIYIKIRKTTNRKLLKRNHSPILTNTVRIYHIKKVEKPKEQKNYGLDCPKKKNKKRNN